MERIRQTINIEDKLFVEGILTFDLDNSPLFFSEDESKERGYLFASFNSKTKEYGHHGGTLREFNKFILVDGALIPDSIITDIASGELKD